MDATKRPAANFQERVLKVRKATTFGPAFAERAMTSGEGSVAMGASFRSTTYTDLGNLKIDNLQLSSVSTPVAGTTRGTLREESRRFGQDTR